MARSLAFAAVLVAVLLAVTAEARELRQVGFGSARGPGTSGYAGDRGGFGADNPLLYGTGQARESVITSDVSGVTSIGAIEGIKDTGDSQAAAYARGMSRATGLTALGLQVSQEKTAGQSSAAGDAIRRSAGYQGNSFAGDIFGGDGFADDSAAGRAIRRTQADNSQLQARIGQRANRYGSSSPFDV